jgi:uncharacterized YigZ family protein
MSGNLQPIKTIKSSSEGEIKEKGSLFKGFVYPVLSENGVQVILNDLKKNYHDATHYCFAYRLKDENFRYSDDGEPSGTAGRRILNAIDHFFLVDTLCVVIRWYGGTKLGTGPLGKAYYASAEAALKSADIITKEPFAYCLIKAPYEYTRQLYHIFDKYQVRIDKKDYSEMPQYHCFLPHEKKEYIIREIVNFSENRIQITDEEKITYL